MAGILSRDERARRDRFVFASDRRDYALAHVLLRTSLSQCAAASPEDWRFTVDRFGKPSIVNRPSSTSLSFTLSHTRGFLACAVAHAPTPIGIDVERIVRRADYHGVASSCLAPHERTTIEKLTAAAYRVRFVELWTLKEALTKAIGLGLRMPLNELSLCFAGNTRVRLAGDDGQWQFLLAEPAPDVRMGLAIRGGDARRRWNVALQAFMPTRRRTPRLLRRSSDRVVPLW